MTGFVVAYALICLLATAYALRCLWAIVREPLRERYRAWLWKSGRTTWRRQ